MSNPLPAVSAAAPARPAAPPALTPRLWGVLVLLGLLWGASFFFTQIAVREIAPFTLVAFRVVLAALALSLFLVLRGIALSRLRKRAGDYLVLGLLNNAVPFTLLALGQTEIGAGLASIVNATTPLWTILAAALLTSDERLSPSRVAGVLLGILGVAVLVGPEALGFGEIGPFWALLAILGASLSYALAGVYAKRLRGTTPSVIAAGQLVAASLVMAPLALLAGDSFPAGTPSAGAILCLVALALVSSAFAYILFFDLIAKAGATNASLVTFLVPASAILLGVMFLGETLTLREVAGFLLILAGLAAVDGRLLGLVRRPHDSPGDADRDGRRLPP